KTALGVNWVDRNWTLVRGDGFPGFNVHRFTTTFGQVYDLGPYFELHLLDRVRLRGAYNLLWVGGVSDPQHQINFDLATHGAPPPGSPRPAPTAPPSSTPRRWSSICSSNWCLVLSV